MLQSSVSQRFLAYGPSFQIKYPTGHFAVLALRGQLVETALHLGQ